MKNVHLVMALYMSTSRSCDQRTSLGWSTATLVRDSFHQVKCQEVLSPSTNICDTSDCDDEHKKSSASASAQQRLRHLSYWAHSNPSSELFSLGVGLTTVQCFPKDPAHPPAWSKLSHTSAALVSCVRELWNTPHIQTISFLVRIWDLELKTENWQLGTAEWC